MTAVARFPPWISTLYGHACHELFIPVYNEKMHLDSCHIRYRTSRTISYVQTYDIVRTVLDVVCYIVYTISYIRYSVTGPTILDLRYRMFIRYRMSTYDIVGQTYDIVSLHENISYTISYVQKYVRCRT